MNLNLFLFYAFKLFDLGKKKHTFLLPTPSRMISDLFLVQTRFTVHSGQGSSCNIHTWMVNHRLIINDSKTEVLFIGSRGKFSKINVNSITFGDSSIEPLKTVGNLGSWLDEQMAIDIHIDNICSKLPITTSNLEVPSTEATKILVHAFVT